MKDYFEEVIVLEAFNSKDYKVLDKSSKETIGFMLRRANAKEGFDLHAYFKLPKNTQLPETCKTLMEGWGIFNRIYNQT
jgi:hypothetical protein